MYMYVWVFLICDYELFLICDSARVNRRIAAFLPQSVAFTNAGSHIEAGSYYSKSTFIMTLIIQEKLVFVLVILYMHTNLKLGMYLEHNK